MTGTVLRHSGLLLALLLGGCGGLNQPKPGSAGLPPTQLPGQLTGQQQTQAPPEFWQIRSRLSVRHGEQAWSGSLRWHHLPDGNEITIRDPIGRTRLRASDLTDKNNHQNGAQATLQLAGQPVRYGQNIQQLLSSVADIYIPFKQFPRWLTATPGEASDIITDPTSGLVKQMTDQGWTITYQKYHRDSTVRLPRKLLISNHDTEIRMVISKWQATTQ